MPFLYPPFQDIGPALCALELSKADFSLADAPYHTLPPGGLQPGYHSLSKQPRLGSLLLFHCSHGRGLTHLIPALTSNLTTKVITSIFSGQCWADLISRHPSSLGAWFVLLYKGWHHLSVFTERPSPSGSMPSSQPAAVAAHSHHGHIQGDDLKGCDPEAAALFPGWGFSRVSVELGADIF